MTYGLMVLGALVRANGAGLACPDWPLCFGEVVPAFDLKVGFEWSHRAVAGAVSLGLAAVTLASVRSGSARHVRAPLIVAWGLLLVQVVLGGLTVLLRLAPWTVVAHLAVGTSFAITLLLISRTLAEGSGQRRVDLPAGVAPVAVVAAAVLAVQVLLGGMVSSSGAGPICGPVFPDCLGRGWFPSFEGLIGLHVLHRANAVLVASLFSALFVLTRGSRAPREIARLSAVATALVWMQFGVGAANVLLGLPVEITGLHTALAAALSLLAALLLREVWLSRRHRADAAPSVSAGAGVRRQGEVATARGGVA